VRTLAAFGIFRLEADGAIAHTSRSLLLRTDAPKSMVHGARFWTSRGPWRAWGELDVALKGGVPQESASGMGFFAFLRDHPAEARKFDAFMSNHPDNRHRAVAAAYDFSRCSLIADVGGGNGEALRQILDRFPNARGVVFDREDVVAAITTDMLAEGRITPRGGSFFDVIPTGADRYLMMRVLHDFADEDVLRILRACLAAMGTSARLLIVETLLEPDPAMGRPTEYMTDLAMMTLFGKARERTEAEFRELLAEAGFDLSRVISTTSPVSILEAAPR